MGLTEDDRLTLFAERVARFYAQGGVIQWGAFQCLTEDEQAVAARIANELRARNAQELGRALRSEEGGASVVAPYDDCEDFASVKLAQFMEATRGD